MVTLLFLVVVFWLLHAMLALTLSIPIAAWSRFRWHRWEILALIVPYGVWALTLALDTNPAGWVLLSVAIAVATLIRVVVGNRHPGSACPKILMGSLCVIAFLLIWIMPPMLPQ
ncbi:MAG: hypothetical protein FJ271_10655 [Planctomycetes bacterium]|nr:hypothetical protein [Planctomycetota bacterium]